jgi:DNA-binding HxlR family transcriptional regulator
MSDTDVCALQDAEQRCYLRRAIRLLEGKYTLLILRALFQGTQRFGSLLALLPGISRRTLAERLRQMTDAGLIVRHAYGEVPPRVEYVLTPEGQAFRETLKRLELLGQALEQPPATSPFPASGTPQGRSEG